MQKEQSNLTTIQRLKYRFRIFKNKYIFTSTVFLIFALFLDDDDIFSLITQKRKLSKIKTDQELVEKKLAETRQTLKLLNHTSAIEKYAREEKLFKKDNEDIFILSYE